MAVYTSKKPFVGVPQIAGLHDSPESVRRAFSILQDYCREVSDRLNAHEQTLRDTGMAPKFAIAGEFGVQPGRLVNVTEDGVALLANAADPDLYATDVCVKVGDRQLTCYSLGIWSVAAVPFTDVRQPLLYLSDVMPGFVQDTPPTTNGYVRQMVGWKKGRRDSVGGMCQMGVACGEYTLL